MKSHISSHLFVNLNSIIRFSRGDVKREVEQFEQVASHWSQYEYDGPVSKCPMSKNSSHKLCIELEFQKNPWIFHTHPHSDDTKPQDFGPFYGESYSVHGHTFSWVSPAPFQEKLNRGLKKGESMGLGEVCIFLPGTLFSPCRLKKTVFLRKSMWGFVCWPLWPTITCIQMKLGVMNEKEWEGIRLTHHVLVLYWPLHNTGNLLLTACITITNFRLMNMVAEHNRFLQIWSVSQRIHVMVYLPAFTDLYGKCR